MPRIWNPSLVYQKQDVCLIAIERGTPVPARILADLPPFRATLIAGVAERAGVPLEGGTYNELRLEASRVGGEGELVWPLR